MKLEPLKIIDDRPGYRYRPVLDRRPNEMTIRERAEFLAHEIFEDRLAPEREIADAIETEIERFSTPLADALRTLKPRKPPPAPEVK